MFKQLGSLASMMKQAQEISGRMEDVTSQLRSQRVEGTSGAGMVKVETNGVGEVLRVVIDPDVFTAGDQEMVEDLLPAAINDAQAKAKALHAESMKSLTAGMDLPGLDEALAKFSGGNQ